MDSYLHQESSLILPPNVLANATVLAGEYAWFPEDALQVVELLAISEYPVVGVELWQNDNGMPRWIATSNYNYRNEGDWKEYVHLCAKSATEFIGRFRHEPGAIFNFS